MTSKTARDLFVVITGLPGSGKSTLGRRLAPALGLPLIDKDDILERLFAQRGIGDAAWRRALSRESDRLLEQEARASQGAVLVSFWRQDGMPGDSGTPTAWIEELGLPVVTVECVCDPAIAAARFVGRQRHAGHLDEQKSLEDVLAGFIEQLRQPRIEIGPRIEVHTETEPDTEAVAIRIKDSVSVG